MCVGRDGGRPSIDPPHHTRPPSHISIHIFFQNTHLHTHGKNTGRHVVRLKIGDPFLFGRGGEEIHEFRAYGVEPQVCVCVEWGIWKLGMWIWGVCVHVGKKVGGNRVCACVCVCALCVLLKTPLR